mmetsp:Transcript_8009/g.20093  ORF Transcript_8009/g.20093 Transcript_8009/m.20093 type:complete len:355 (+) Transcript_8009:150-1214(+)
MKMSTALTVTMTSTVVLLVGLMCLSAAPLSVSSFSPSIHGNGISKILSTTQRSRRQRYQQNIDTASVSVSRSTAISLGGLAQSESESETTTTASLLDKLESWIHQAPKNGISTPPEIESKIVNICERLEALDAGSSAKRQQQPSSSSQYVDDFINGFWKLRWSNYIPAGPSSGKIGPFVGDVYQDLKLELEDVTVSKKPPTGSSNQHNFARNIFRLDWPKISQNDDDTPNPALFGELYANPYVYSHRSSTESEGNNDDSSAATTKTTTIAIAFEGVGSKLMPWGWNVGPQIQFDPNKEIRLWEHVYVDGQYRIFYARNADGDAASSSSGSRGYLYVCRRCSPNERFVTGVHHTA